MILPSSRRLRPLALAARLFLGFVFVYAAQYKIRHPPEFAKEILAYGLLPGPLVNLWAIYLPWIELLSGALLLLGPWRRTAALATGGLLLMFLLAIGSRFARGERDFDCGCFPPSHGAIDHLPVLGPLKAFLLSSHKGTVTFARDLVFLALAALAFKATTPPPGKAGS